MGRCDLVTIIMNKRKASTLLEKALKRVKYVGEKKVGQLNKRRLMQKYGSKQAKIPEAKFFDNSINVNPSSAGAVFLLNSLAEGSDNTDRIGRKITINNVQYELVVAASTGDLGNAATYPESFDCIRVSLVWDKQPNGANPAYGDIYNSTSNLLTPMCLRNINYVDRFEILATDMVNICAAGPNAETIRRYIKTNLDARYQGTGGGIANISSGALFLAYSDANTTGTQLAIINGRVRIKFSDD